MKRARWRASPASQPEEDVYATAMVALAEAYIATAEGDRNTALARYRTALALIEEEHFLVDVAEARLSYARALRDLGLVEGARHEFARRAQSSDRWTRSARSRPWIDRLRRMERGPAEPAPIARNTVRKS